MLLALFDGEDGNMEDRLRLLGGANAVNTFHLCNRGAHGQLLEDLARQLARL